MIKHTIKQLIATFYEDPIPTPKHRFIELPQLPNNIRKAIVLIGMRRSGKTWFLYQIMHQLMQQGINKKQIVYLNFEDDRLSSLQPDQFQEILNAYFEMYPDETTNDKLYFFFDEIQEIEGWEKFIRRLLDTTPHQIYLSGSSAKMLSKEISTSLRGRSLTRELFPFSFQEYLNYNKINIPNIPTHKQQAILTSYANRYVLRGGFPETMDAEETLRDELIQGYVNSVVFRDVIERYSITNVLAVRQLMSHCMKNAASRLSINKTYQDFKSRGISVSRESLHDYMDYFEDAYCFFSIPLFSYSYRQTKANPSKIYPVDTGMISAFTVKPAFDEGARLETAVFCHLRRSNPSIYYYKTKTEKEIDFLIQEKGGNRLYQSCLSLNSSTTKQRELEALDTAMSELKTTKAYIITLNEQADIKMTHGNISVLPLWRFLTTTSL